MDERESLRSIFLRHHKMKSGHLLRRVSHGDDRRLEAKTAVKLKGPRNAVSTFGFRIWRLAQEVGNTRIHGSRV